MAEEITQLIKESTTRVGDGSRLSNEVGTSLAEILGGIEKTGSAMSSIRSATSEQSATASEVSKGMENISGVTEQNSASAEQMSASAEELAAQAQRLQQLVDRFKIDAATVGDRVSVDHAMSPPPRTMASSAQRNMSAALPTVTSDDSLVSLDEDEGGLPANSKSEYRNPKEIRNSNPE